MSDILQGTCTRDGKKVDGTAKITTSWNNKYAVAKNGTYKLDFGAKVGKSIDIYVNGAKYDRVNVSGTTTLNIQI
jgi:hypothetical protein